MMRIRAVSALLLSMLAPVSASAATGQLIMSCAWERSTDMQSLKTTKISGSTEVSYDPINDLTGTMTKEGFEHPFVASTGDKLIEGVAHYTEDGAPAEQRIEINRYSGAILNFIKTSKGTIALEGTCKRVSGPAFGADNDGE